MLRPQSILETSLLTRAAGSALALIVVAGFSTSVLAQGTPAPGKAAPPAAAPPAQQVVMPDADKILLLIRTAVLTLNDALQTGNFTVLRDVAAPSFRETHSAARLAAAFSGLAADGIDLSAAAILAPQLTEPPTLDPASSVLRLKGLLGGQPALAFDLAYQAVAGRWRLIGIGVVPTALRPTAATPATGAAPGPPAAGAAPAKQPPAKADPRAPAAPKAAPEKK